MVEEGGETWSETAACDGGGVAEGFGEDGSGGEFVVGFVRVVEDEDPGCGFDGVHGKDVAETHRIGTAAVGADGSTVRLRRGGGWEVIGGVVF